MSDILWQNSNTGEVYLWLMNRTSTTNQGSPGTVSLAWSIKGVGGYNGDGKADILWQNTSGETELEGFPAADGLGTERRVGPSEG
jgi:hypothetical protein